MQKKAKTEFLKAQGDFWRSFGTKQSNKKAKSKGCKGKWKIHIDYFGNGNAVRNSFVGMVSVIPGGEMGKIAAGNYEMWKTV